MKKFVPKDEQIINENVQDDVQAGTSLKDTDINEYGVLPVKGLVLFPHAPAPLAIGKDRSIRLINNTLKENQDIVVVGIKPEALEKEEPAPDDLYTVGTLARAYKMIKLNENYYQIVFQGISRVEILDYTQVNPYLRARVRDVEEDRSRDRQVEALDINLRKLFDRYLQLTNINFPVDLLTGHDQHPADLSYTIAAHMDLDVALQQEILEMSDLKERLQILIQLLSNKLDALELSQEIQNKMKRGIEKNQREALLREQMKTIQKELDMDDGQSSELEDFRKRIEEADLPAEALKTANQELDRLSKMSPAAAEYTVSRTYLEWILDLPWNKTTADNLEIENARRILDEDHYGLQKVKKRILEYLAVRKLKQDLRGPILCFVGPPGVGKTSLGRSIARSLGRKFVRISLGGIRDEAEIRGHRRTYVGALPGRIIQSLRKAGTSNPVFMLDEIDKLSADFRGDPSSALLEALDPEQNNSFSDHYLEIPYDLSKVLFVTTANLLDPIPPALQDRLEVIHIPGYVDEEKLLIAKRHLLPRERAEHGMTEDQITITDDGMAEVIRFYTREAGVRNLQREIASLCRGVAIDIAAGKAQHISVDPQAVPRILGSRKFLPETEVRNWGPGLCTGLAWTPVGGELIFVEVNRMKGGKSLILTGQLGNVMKESATAALSYIRSHSQELGLDEDFYHNIDLHIHVPAGGIPKDGPSAGVAIFCALVSLLTGQPVRKDVAMTGEITLRGDVLAVGGIKEKVLAAARGGMKTVILPEINRKDLEDIPEHSIQEIDIRFVHHMGEVLDIAIPLVKANAERVPASYYEACRYGTCQPYEQIHQN